MPQVTSQTAPNSGGTAYRTNINNILGALFSSSSGATAPTVTVGGQTWFDTTAGVLKVRNAANTDWITVGVTDYASLAEALAGTLTNKAINPDILKRILDGAASAPRIVGAAHKRLADFPVLTVSAADTVPAANLCTEVAGTTSTTSTSFVTARTITVERATGSLRFSARCNENTATDGELEIRKNGVFVNTFDAGVTAVQDISVVPTDVITWHIKREGSTGAVTFTNLGITASDSYVERPAYVAHSLKDQP